MNREWLLGILSGKMPEGKDLVNGLKLKNIINFDKEKEIHHWNMEMLDKMNYVELLLLYNSIKLDLEISAMVREAALIIHVKNS